MDVQKLYTAFVMREKINEASDGILYADYKMHRFIRYVKSTNTTRFDGLRLYAI